ncbi:MAG: hypothetical protein IAE80_30070, partial [Anaerolinea sp.]|nr:hypothetical protein [Anaerolinea sp.]
RIALEVNGAYAHRSDGESLRCDTLLLYFDDVIILTEAEIKKTPNLPAYIQKLLA